MQITETRTAFNGIGLLSSCLGTRFADVLCAVDGTRASFTAVEQSLALAGAGASVTLFAVSATAGTGPHRTIAVSSRRVERMLSVAKQIAREARAANTHVIDNTSPPSRVIVERARNHDLLAMGAPRTSWLAGLFVDGVAVSAMHSFTTPLLLARPTPKERHFGRRIVVASDGGEESDHLVELAAGLAGKQRGEVLLVHALHGKSTARPHRVRTQMRMLEASLPHTCEMYVEPSTPHEQITEVARSTQASLIVVGSRRLDGSHALGSVSERVVHEAPCSVLVVPPPS